MITLSGFGARDKALKDVISIPSSFVSLEVEGTIKTTKNIQENLAFASFTNAGSFETQRQLIHGYTNTNKKTALETYFVVPSHGSTMRITTYLSIDGVERKRTFEFRIVTQEQQADKPWIHKKGVLEQSYLSSSTTSPVNGSSKEILRCATCLLNIISIKCKLNQQASCSLLLDD